MFALMHSYRLESLHLSIDPVTGLKAVIAIHNSRLGPALGGCRYLAYPDDETAVEVVYRSSRDLERLFMDKAEADRHDKMLELAELLAEVLQKAVPSLSEQQVEEAGIYMAKNRDVFAKAFKSQPDALSELLNAAAE